LIICCSIQDLLRIHHPNLTIIKPLLQ
jgi:hypothetical protein